MKNKKLLAERFDTLAKTSEIYAKEIRRAARRGESPPPRGPGSAHAAVRDAYAAFWKTPGANEYANAIFD